MLSSMDPDISVPADYNSSAEKLVVEPVDKCRNRFQDGVGVYRLARALDLDIMTISNFLGKNGQSWLRLDITRLLMDRRGITKKTGCS
jgi:hypothetical protein